MPRIAVWILGIGAYYGWFHQQHLVHSCHVDVVLSNSFFNHVVVAIVYPIGSMYAIYGNIWGILMVNVTIYGIHGSYRYVCLSSPNVRTGLSLAKMPRQLLANFAKQLCNVSKAGVEHTLVCLQWGERVALAKQNRPRRATKYWQSSLEIMGIVRGNVRIQNGLKSPWIRFGILFQIIQMFILYPSVFLSVLFLGPRCIGQ